MRRATIIRLTTGADEREKVPDATVPMARTAKGIESVLFDEIDALRLGYVTPRHAHAMARSCMALLAWRIYAAESGDDEEPQLVK
jgi:hypothetical protein